MTESLWERASALFDAALDAPAEERAAWLEAQAGDDSELRAEVASMLAAHERADGVLERRIHIPPEDVADHLQNALGGEYEIVRELGRGGMAIVFLAWERKHDRRVVFKVLQPSVAATYGADRFLREVRLAGRLTHPHILGLIDSGTADGLLYYVMPYVEGETLRDRLKRRGTLKLEESVTLLKDIASALAHAHNEGVVHRDLKPDNILCAGSHAFLMDFGIAKRLLDSADSAHGEALTQTGHAIGTPKYMAPEQLLGRADVDHRADIYAWGLVAHEMLTGTVPPISASRIADGTSGQSATDAVLASRPEVPETLARLIGQCAEGDPETRCDSADHIIWTLEHLSAPIREITPQPAGRGARLWIPVAASMVVVVAAVGLAIARWGGPSTVPDAAEMSVAVAAFSNETGDSTLAPLGRMAGDWITQGLQQTGLASVVPWPTALQASDVADAARSSGEPVDIVSHMQSETGADLVVTGSVYRVGEQLVFRAEVTDAEHGQVLSAPNPVAVPPDSAEAAIRALRDRLMTSLAISSNETRVTSDVLNRNLPTFEAYRAFDRGLELHNRQEYRRAAPEFLRAYELDTTFTATLLHAAAALQSSGEFAAVDSLVDFLALRRDRLGEYEDLRFQYMQAVIDSDGERALRALQRSAELAPESKSAYSSAVIALQLNRPHLAYEVLSGLDPDRGSLRGWAAYWTYLTHSSHLVGDHEGELAAAREMRIRHPERRIAVVLEARALAVLGRTEELDRVLEAAGALAPNTYWSQGAALVVAGEELVSHGDSALGWAYLERAIDWLDNELVAEPDLREHLYWLGSAYYDLGRWSEALATFDALASRYPERLSYTQTAALAAAHLGDRAGALERLRNPGPYEAGTYTAYRARLEAIAGDPEVAISLLSEALGQGVDGWSWLHASAYADWSRVKDNARFQRIIRGDASPGGS